MLRRTVAELDRGLHLEATRQPPGASGFFLADPQLTLAGSTFKVGANLWPTTTGCDPRSMKCEIVLRGGSSLASTGQGSSDING